MQHPYLTQAFPQGLIDQQEIDHSLTGIAEPVNPLIDELGSLFAKHKLVPFFGAGVSRQHLNLGSEDLAHEMADVTGVSRSTRLADVADLYEERLGRKALAELLHRRLFIEKYEDEKAPLHRLLLSLWPEVVYTTNQDNIFELASKHYGRDYKAVVVPSDLRDARYDEPLLIKFHGDPAVADSLVFSARSYRERMAVVDHPLDVKLKADLFGKRLMFIGYSLQDENIGQILAAVKQALGKGMAPSYLLAYKYDPAMEALREAYDVQVIDPMKFVAPGMDTHTAFECVLKAICDSTLHSQASFGLERVLSDDLINVRVLTEYELSALETFIESVSPQEAIKAFRARMDWTDVPSSLGERALALTLRIIGKIDPTVESQMTAMKHALFNLYLPGIHQLDAVAAFMAIFNRRPTKPGYDELSSLPIPALPDKCMSVAAAMAVGLIQDSGQSVTEGFRKPAAVWFQGYQDLEGDMKLMAEIAMEDAWPDTMAAKSPAKQRASVFKAKGFHELNNEMMERLPKRFRI